MKTKKYQTPKLHNRLTHLTQLLHSVKYMLAGGSVLTHIQRVAGKNGRNQSNHSDYDLYFQTEEDYTRAKELFIAESKTDSDSLLGDVLTLPEPSLENESIAAITFYWKKDNIQLIKHYGAFKDTLANFDLVNSMCYSFAPFDTSYGPDVDGVLEYSIRNSKEDITFNEISRILKYKQNKNLKEDRIIQEAFELLQKYPDIPEAAFKRSLYSGEKINTTAKKESIVKNVLVKITANSELFCEHATKEELRGRRLPYHLVESDNLFYIKQTGIRYLTFLQSMEQQKRGVSFEDFKAAHSYMAEYFPEELL